LGECASRKPVRSNHLGAGRSECVPQAAGNIGAEIRARRGGNQLRKINDGNKDITPFAKCEGS
jgi:hypothetical protein